MLTLHILSVIFSFVVVLFADKQGLSWIRGKKEMLNARRVRFLHILIWVGLFALLATGAALFWPMREYLLRQPLFLIKMLFVAVLFVNAILIGRLMRIATERAFASLSWNERATLFLSGAVSFIGWVGTVIVALVLFG